MDVPAWIRPHSSPIILARVWTFLKWFVYVAVDERYMYPLLPRDVAFRSYVSDGLAMALLAFS